MDRHLHHALSRRAFLQNGALYMVAGLVESETSAHSLASFSGEPVLRVGYLTDIHYADTDDRGARNYRASLGKMIEAVERLNAQHIQFAVHGGDLIDALPDPDDPSEKRFLKRINAEFARLKVKRHYVLGNHCVYSLTKPEFLDIVERPRSYYSFDQHGFHFVVLDACCRQDDVDYGRRNFDWKDTEIPAAQRDWLAQDLKATKHKTVVFVHQRLDLPVGEEDAVHSAPAVREVLEKSGKVVAVFMGHSHVNDYRAINDIHYCTLDAVIGGDGQANNAYSVLEVYKDGSLKLDGFCKHTSNPFVKQTSA